MSTSKSSSNMGQILDMLCEHPILLEPFEAILNAIEDGCTENEVTQIGKDSLAAAQAKGLSEDEQRQRVEAIRAEARKHYPGWFMQEPQQGAAGVLQSGGRFCPALFPVDVVPVQDHNLVDLFRGQPQGS